MKIIYLQMFGIIQHQMVFTMEKNLLVVGAMENFSTIQSRKSESNTNTSKNLFIENGFKNTTYI